MRERKATTESELGRSMFGGRKNLGSADTSSVGNLSCSASAVCRWESQLAKRWRWDKVRIRCEMLLTLGATLRWPLGENDGGLGRLVDVVRDIQKKVVEVKPKSSEW